ncbi:hypothetical protein WA026_012507 [Henosepilachna vigintioctopunctata]|uniref:Uncharacterized protein n=1 Tax=Henosepilachna vigintioctopunctata TaxID=420089 RepID=A0AAW1UY35_9CUCU
MDDAMNRPVMSTPLTSSSVQIGFTRNRDKPCGLTFHMFIIIIQALNVSKGVRGGGFPYVNSDYTTNMLVVTLQSDTANLEMSYDRCFLVFINLLQLTQKNGVLFVGLWALPNTFNLAGIG